MMSTSSRTPYAGSITTASPVSRSPTTYTKFTICCAIGSDAAKSRPGEQLAEVERSVTVRVGHARAA